MGQAAVGQWEEGEESERERQTEIERESEGGGWDTCDGHRISLK